MKSINQILNEELTPEPTTSQIVKNLLKSGLLKHYNENELQSLFNKAIDNIKWGGEDEWTWIILKNILVTLNVADTAERRTWYKTLNLAIQYAKWDMVKVAIPNIQEKRSEEIWSRIAISAAEHNNLEIFKIAAEKKPSAMDWQDIAQKAAQEDGLETINYIETKIEGKINLKWNTIAVYAAAQGSLRVIEYIWNKYNDIIDWDSAADWADKNGRNNVVDFIKDRLKAEEPKEEYDDYEEDESDW